jgi:addiction module HigA family antidote
VLGGASAITPAMALRIGKFCGNGPGVWLRMQEAHDLWHAERAIASELAKIKTAKAA